MSTQSKKLLTLWGAFAIFVLLYFIKIVALWPMLSLWSIVLAIFLLIKNKFPSLKRTILAIVLSILASCVILFTIWGEDTASVIVSVLYIFIPTVIASLAVFSVMEKYGDFELIKSDSKKEVFISIGMAVGIGLVLGIINCFLRTGNSKIDINFAFKNIILCLNPAIHEEITDRAIFMAFCFYICRGTKLTKFQTFTMWFMMIVPHTMSHEYGLPETLVLLVLFGLPFAILQRKRDLTSSMISHGLVDAIRFVAFGM